MSVLTSIDNAISMIEIAVDDLPRVRTSELGLDERAGYVSVDLDDRCIIVNEGSKRSLDYYGGFEYVPEDHVTEIGGYKIYAEEGRDGGYCERVERAIDSYLENGGE